MSWLVDLLFKPGVAHSILLIALTIAGGILLSKIKIKGISLGITWILFAGIFFSHFGMRLEPQVSHFAKELGLIIFVYSVGLQVGPGFFSSFRQGGIQLNLLAACIVTLGCATAYVIHLVTGESISTMVGVLYGAVTNTPGLGAAQQTYLDVNGVGDPNIALGYAVAYPLGVIGIITSMLVIKGVFRVKMQAEAESVNVKKADKGAESINVKVNNKGVDGLTIGEVGELLNRQFVVARIMRQNGGVEVALANSVINQGDVLRVVVVPKDKKSVIALFGEKVNVDSSVWEGQQEENLIGRRIVVTQPKMNGRRIGELNISSLYGVTITRVNRAGVDLVAVDDLRLQMGDRVNVVGTDDNVDKVAKILGNSLRRLDSPNLFPIFIGIALGVILGSIPFVFPGIPQPIKLGLAGGPLIVAILIARYGPYYKMITFTTTSANMMLREVGISLFLATVGLDAGVGFVETVINGGYWWVLYGAIITIVPLLLIGAIARLWLKLDYFTLVGMLAGSTTDPPALAYANSISSSVDRASVSYATVYPLTMFLRVLAAQLMILFL